MLLADRERKEVTGGKMGAKRSKESGTKKRREAASYQPAQHEPATNEPLPCVGICKPQSSWGAQPSQNKMGKKGTFGDLEKEWANYAKRTFSVSFRNRDQNTP